MACSNQIRAPLIVGADGRHSVVARSLGLDTPLRWPRKTGLAAHYRGVTGLDGYGEMHVGHGVYAGLAPIEHGMANLTIVLPDRSVEDRSGSVEELFADALRRLPALAHTLEGAERVDGIRGVGSMGQRARRTTGDGYPADWRRGIVPRSVPGRRHLRGAARQRCWPRRSRVRRCAPATPRPRRWPVPDRPAPGLHRQAAGLLDRPGFRERAAADELRDRPRLPAGTISA